MRHGLCHLLAAGIGEELGVGGSLCKTTETAETPRPLFFCMLAWGEKSEAPAHGGGELPAVVAVAAALASGGVLCSEHELEGVLIFG